MAREYRNNVHVWGQQITDDEPDSIQDWSNILRSWNPGFIPTEDNVPWND